MGGQDHHSIEGNSEAKKNQITVDNCFFHSQVKETEMSFCQKAKAFCSTVVKKDSAEKRRDVLLIRKLTNSKRGMEFLESLRDSMHQAEEDARDRKWNAQQLQFPRSKEQL